MVWSLPRRTTTKGGQKLSIGHRIADRSSLPFRSEAAVEAYLNPHSAPGCGHHADPDCLCDVTVTEPVPLVRTPRQFVHVQTTDDLVLAACNLWLALDIMRPRELERMRNAAKGPVVDRQQSYCTPVADMVEAMPADELQRYVALVKSGYSLAETRERLGYFIPDDLWVLLRRVFDVPRAHRNGRKIPVQDVVNLGDTGMSATEIVNELEKRYGYRWGCAAVMRRYKVERGVKLRDGRTRRS